MWLSLIALIEKHSMKDVNIVGIMADNRVIRKVGKTRV